MKKTVILNSDKFNYDGKLDFSGLERLTDVISCGSTSSGEILLRVENADIVITKELPLPGDIIRKFPDSVKLICEAGTGYNNIDIAAAKERGITVCNVPGYSTGAVAQLAISFILNLSSSIPQQQVMLKQGNLDNFTKHLLLPHHEVEGKVLGVIGAGSIGRRVIEIALSLGMDVIFYDSNPDSVSRPGVEYSQIDDLFRRSDFISLHCPLTQETKHIVCRDKLRLMKPSAYIINTSRGALIKESDLIEALKSSLIAGAALDVQEVEPPAAENPLFAMDNVIMTPHIGWQTLESRQRLMERLVSNIQAFLDGNPVNVVN